ncbi:hypothetical protein RUND412_005200 [Rhizina undulata]
MRSSSAYYQGIGSKGVGGKVGEERKDSKAIKKFFECLLGLEFTELHELMQSWFDTNELEMVGYGDDVEFRKTQRITAAMGSGIMWKTRKVAVAMGEPDSEVEGL